MEDGILGDFEHLVVDEAHTLEKVLIDGWGEEVSPYEMWKSLESIWTGLDASNSRTDAVVAKMQEAEHFIKEGVNSIVALFTALAERRSGDWLDDQAWRRESFTLSEQYLSGSVDVTLRDKLEQYELQGPGRFRVASDNLKSVHETLKKDLEDRERGNRKVSKAKNAAKRLATVLDMVAESLTTRDGIVMRYGVPYVVLGEGYKAYKGTHDVKIRCVPLDISSRAYETIWKPLKSATLVSGTLRDETDGSFRYTVNSLGLKNAKQIIVGSGFDYAQNQLVYVTPGTYDPIDVPGARYSMEELVNVIEASNGRALILFTATAEMEYAAGHLRQLQQSGQFVHRLLVQERGVSKPELVRMFMEDTSSVLLGSKSFFTGVDFPGEACSIVVLAKFPLPQYNSLCRAQIAWWRSRGFPQWYEREALQVFKQANGRLIRSESDRGVIAILDNRVADPKERVCDLTRMELTTTGSAFTNDIHEMERWLGAVNA
jgi:Rad3-related DNA helicase